MVAAPGCNRIRVNYGIVDRVSAEPSDAAPGFQLIEHFRYAQNSSQA